MNFKLLHNFLLLACLLSPLSARGVETEIEQDIVGQITQQDGVIEFQNYVMDFGEVGRGQTLKHSFNFSNVGKGPLIILGVHASCGCTAVELDRGRSYGAGEEGNIDVSFDTTDFSGKVAKTFTILTNEHIKRVRILTVKANVKNSIAVNPPLVDFGDIKISRGTQRQIVLSPLDGRAFNVESIKSTSNFSTSYKKDGDNWLVDIYAAESIARGSLRDTLLIKTDHPTLKSIPVPLVAQVLGIVNFQPEYLEFGSVPSENKTEKILNLTSETKFTISASKATMYVNGEKVDANKYLEFQMPKEILAEHQLKIGIKNAKELVGSVSGDITIETDLPNRESIKVEYYAFFQEK